MASATAAMSVAVAAMASAMGDAGTGLACVERHLSGTRQGGVPRERFSRAEAQMDQRIGPNEV